MTNEWLFKKGEKIKWCWKNSLLRTWMNFSYGTWGPQTGLWSLNIFATLIGKTNSRRGNENKNELWGFLLSSCEAFKATCHIQGFPKKHVVKAMNNEHHMILKRWMIVKFHHKQCFCQWPLLEQYPGKIIHCTITHYCQIIVT